MAVKFLDDEMTYLKASAVTRDKIEKDLQFLGFMVMENKLKKAS